jgi:cysteine-S-conjugate beta-lyase
VIQAVTLPGSGIVINPPVYQPFFRRLRLAGRRVIAAPLRRRDDGRYDLDPVAIDRALAADGVSAYLFATGHDDGW